ncbi:MAG: hypothetical protein JHC78_11290, partial [Ilumatobacteraceae bacterium]|nr:hypothetical protein [Ilumatobacteraceae bacterium]
MTSQDEPFVTPIESAVTDVPESLLSELKEILQRDVEQVVKITDATLEASSPTPVEPPAEVDLSSSVIVIDDSVHETAVTELVEHDRILIVDQDEPDIRFEERRRKSERRERIKNQRWKLILGAGVTGVIVVVIVLASPIFKIHNIDFEGKVYTSSDKLDQAREMLRGQTIFSLDSGRV